MKRITSLPMLSIYRTTRLAVIALLSTVFTSCADIQLYEGVHSSNEIATIKPYHAAPFLVQIQEVDGVRVNSVKADFTKSETIKVLPGRHIVKAELPGQLDKMHRALFETTGRATLNFDAEAGKVYLVNGRHGGPEGWRIWIAEASTGTVVAGNGPSAHITSDKSISLPFVKPVWAYAVTSRLLGQTIYDRYEGTLTINDSSVEIELCILKPLHLNCSEETLKISKGNIQDVILGKFFTTLAFGIMEENGRDPQIEAIFIHYIESGENKVIVLTSIPSDTEQDSYIYSALLHITKTVP